MGEAQQEIAQYNILTRRSISEVKSIVLEALGITEEIIYKSTKNDIYNKILIYALCRYTDAKHRTRGELFSFHYSMISRIAKEIFDIARTNSDIASKLKLIDRAIYCGGARSCISDNMDW